MNDELPEGVCAVQFRVIREIADWVILRVSMDKKTWTLNLRTFPFFEAPARVFAVFHDG